MKILVLNPHVDAQHQVVKTLRDSGFSVLLTQNVEQAWQVLQFHGETIALAWVHREGGPGKAHDLGLSFLFKAKSDPSQSDMPVLVTSESWGPAEFAQHQQTPLGANAYLRWPCNDSELLSVLREVLGVIEAPAPAAVPSDSISLEEMINPVEAFTPPVSSEEPTGQIVLESPQDSIGAGQNFNSDGNSGISLIMPIEPAGEDVSELSPPAAEFTPVLAPPDSSGEDELAMPTFEADSASDGDADDVAPELLQEMPYLFGKSEKKEPLQAAPVPQIHHPVGDAVVPGGAAQAPDTETLKKYLLLREQDVAALSTQLKASQDQIASLEARVREESARNTELTATANEQKRRIEDFERDKSVAMEGLQAEINDLKFQAKSKADKARMLEALVREATQEMERLKDRVRADIRKIRVREKELENRLEIMRKDSEVLITAREGKIMELKRKLDILEFNMDLLQNQHSREKETSAELRKRLAKAAQVVRVAGGLLGASAGEVLEELSAELDEQEDRTSRKIS